MSARVCFTGVLCCGALWAAHTLAATEQDHPLDALGWMSGCWERVAGDVVIEEQWMRPRGGLMLGMNRTLRSGRADAHEYLRISDGEGGGFVLVAQPSGQAVAEFPAVTLADTLALFENPAHDFPRRILYRPGPDSLWARIEGPSDGGTRGMDFRMGRVACG